MHRLYENAILFLYDIQDFGFYRGFWNHSAMGTKGQSMFLHFTNENTEALNSSDLPK
jgi:hypothetical protein